jgi:putative DNA primase/helicase
VLAANYQDVLDQLQRAGLIVSSLETGAMKRCRVEGDREKRGWYTLHEIQLPGGDLVIVGSYGIWHGNDNGAQKVDLRKRDGELTNEQREALRRRQVEDRKRAANQRRAQAERAAVRAAGAWARYAEDGESEYLAAKCVQGYGLRYTSAGSAVVPLLDVSGKIHGLQFLRSAKQADQAKRPAKELWPAGMVKQGHFHLIGSPQWIVLVAEGYATAASLHMATGYPVAVAFDAGNLLAVATELKKRYREAKILVCADDDVLQRCQQRDCRARLVLSVSPKTCPSCGQDHKAENAGTTAASVAAMAVNGAWIVPRFEDEDERRAVFLGSGRKLSDFNDLHVEDGLHLVRVQVEGKLSELAWRAHHSRAPITTTGQGGERLRPLQSVTELLERYVLVYAHSGAVFDRSEHMLLSLSDMRDACVRKDVHRAWCESSDREIVRIREVGFDPAGTDPHITCNLWAGWPTVPKAGKCERVLEILQHMCSLDRESTKLYHWVLKWLAYPLQHPGAKMKTTIVVHGPQGTGKNLFFETIMAIYGQYGDVIDQSAVEDKFNDWASRKLFMIADEVVARMDVFHVKNKLKSLITGNRIRINPKNFAAYWENNHVNLVFLSNETMPLVLEEDDRRHCIIWTPEKREGSFYASVLAELADGGAEALHDFLMKVDLGDFHEGSPAPMTEAKDELINLALDSPTRFYYALYEGEVGGIIPRPALTTDAYALYKAWCHQSSNRPAPQHKFVNALGRKHGVVCERKRYIGSGGDAGPHGILMLGKTDAPDGESEKSWLGRNIQTFRDALDDSKGRER